MDTIQLKRRRPNNYFSLSIKEVGNLSAVRLFLTVV